jgi:septum formation protein
MNLRLILASTSPRRRELLESLGIRFEVVFPEVDELRHPNEEPYDYVSRIARAKAEAAVALDAVVVAADTIVVIDGHVLGKPGHPEEAMSMLRRLGSTTHEVLTGVAVARTTDLLQVVTAVESTLVKFLPMTDEEIVDYVGTGEQMDKAVPLTLSACPCTPWPDSCEVWESTYSRSGETPAPGPDRDRRLRRSGLDNQPRTQRSVEHNLAARWIIDYIGRNQHDGASNHVRDYGRTRVGPCGGQSLRVDGVVVGRVGGARGPQ